MLKYKVEEGKEADHDSQNGKDVQTENCSTWKQTKDFDCNAKQLFVFTILN